jgi:hypothetical protein
MAAASGFRVSESNITLDQKGISQKCSPVRLVKPTDPASCVGSYCSFSACLAMYVPAIK